ncbi:hypothetical protein ACI65C_009872 [Semiaphis heraclei]
MSDTRIMFWNSQGVTRKRIELLDLVQRKKIDIILLNETHLSSNRQFKLPNFITYSTNRPLVSKRPSSSGRHCSPSKQKIYTSQHQDQYNIHYKYGNPDDLNAKHQALNSRSNNMAGRALLRYMNSRLDSTVTTPSSPTRYLTHPNHNLDDLDIAIINTSCLGYHLINLPSELSSDHSPVLIDIHHRSAHVSPPKPLYFTDWQKYETDMEPKSLLLPPLSTEDPINSAIQIITDFISENVKSNSVTHNPSDRKSDLPPVILSDLLHLNREEEWSNFLGSIEPSAQGWSKIYKLNRQLLRKSLPTNPLKDELGNLHYDSEVKANIFATYMENQFSVLPNTSWIDEVVHESLNKHKNSSYDRTIFFSPGEIWNSLRKLFPTKAQQDRT